jgi:hypothetical protein
MSRNRSLGTLLLAGVAAFAYYKYRKMTPQQRTDFLNGIKDKGKKVLSGAMPDKTTAGANYKH